MKDCNTCKFNKGDLCAHEKAQIRHPDGTYELKSVMTMRRKNVFVTGDCVKGKLWELKR